MVAGGMESISNSSFYLRREALFCGGVYIFKMPAISMPPLPMFILTGTWEKCAEHTAKTMNIGANQNPLSLGHNPTLWGRARKEGVIYYLSQTFRRGKNIGEPWPLWAPSTALL